MKIRENSRILFLLQALAELVQKVVMVTDRLKRVEAQDLLPQSPAWVHGLRPQVVVHAVYLVMSQVIRQLSVVERTICLKAIISFLIQKYLCSAYWTYSNWVNASSSRELSLAHSLSLQNEIKPTKIN